MIKNRFAYYPLSRIETTAGRKYQCPDGNLVPSVTTILGRTQTSEKTEILENWRSNVGSNRARQITDEAAARGTRMHSFLEKHIKGQPPPEQIKNPYLKQSYDMARKVIDLGLVNVSEIWGTEINLWYPEIYAGTTDCLGLHLGKESILDFKQTNKPKKREWIDDYFIQLVCYGTAHNRIYNTQIQKGVIMMCSQKFEYQEFILEGRDWAKYENKMWDRIDQFYDQEFLVEV